MKKLIAALFMAGALALTGCQADKMTSSASKKRLVDNGYTVEVYAEAEAKVRIDGLNYEGVTFTDALFAEKGAGENKDFLVAFYFADMDAADKFLSKNSYENLTILNHYGEKNVGEKLEKKVGQHNNVAYVGSTTSFATAFDSDF